MGHLSSVCVFQAIQELVVAVRSKPSPEMFMLLGRTCQNAGDHNQAIGAFDRAIEATVSISCKALLHNLLNYIHTFVGAIIFTMNVVGSIRVTTISCLDKS